MFGLLAASTTKKEESREKQRKKRLWMKERRKARELRGYLQICNREPEADMNECKSYFGMDESCFNIILSAIKKDIEKRDTVMRQAIPPAKKLAITLRFLATGESFKDLDKITQLSESFLSKAILETCDAIFKNMKTNYLKFPSNKDQWHKIAKEFEIKWQFPLCVGAIDRKHIAFTPSSRDAALYYNIKGFHSIIMLAVADASGRFTFVDIGRNGRLSDNEVLQRSDLMNVLLKPDIYLPPKKTIGDDRVLPYVFVAGNEFPLMENIMTPYFIDATNEFEKTFNYRLDRSRYTVERAFEIFSNRFQIVKHKIRLNAIKSIKIMLCCCVLHNFLISNSPGYSKVSPCENFNTQENTIEELLQSIDSTKFPITEDKQNEKEAKIIRTTFADYFNNEGKF